MVFFGKWMVFFGQWMVPNGRCMVFWGAWAVSPGRWMGRRSGGDPKTPEWLLQRTKTQPCAKAANNLRSIVHVRGLPAIAARAPIGIVLQSLSCRKQDLQAPAGGCQRSAFNRARAAIVCNGCALFCFSLGCGL